jgi:uncharacterized protein with GYD domain
MEKALMLGKLSYRVPKNIIERFKKIEGVVDADMVLGPYDFYTIIETDSKDELGEISLKMRSIEGVLDTLTCYIITLDDIRPEATGPYAN